MDTILFSAVFTFVAISLISKFSCSIDLETVVRSICCVCLRCDNSCNRFTYTVRNGCYMRSDADPNLRNRLQHFIEFLLFSFLFAYNRCDGFDLATTFIDRLQQFLRFFLEWMQPQVDKPKEFAFQTLNP